MKRLRICFAALTASLACVSQASAQTIVIPHENITDLRGVLNVFEMFQQACLTQPVTRDLPERIVPEGYSIASFAMHLWGEEDASLGDTTAILTRTGTEQGDWDAGAPYVTLNWPTDTAPYGRCSVAWKRAWDYDDGHDDVAMGVAGVLDAQVSYRLSAILRSVPADSFVPRGPYSGVSEWVTWCWDGNFCGFNLRYSLHPEDGFDIAISRTAVR